MYQTALFMLVAMLVVALAVTVAFIAFEVTHHHLAAFFVKGFASFCFILIAVGSMLYQIVERGWFAVAENPLVFSLFLPGLVLGLMGDLFLAIRTLRPKAENARIILGGTITFALGHVFYLTALFALYGFRFWVFFVAALLTAAVYAAALVMKLSWGKLKVPCTIYTFLLFLFASQAVYGWIAVGAPGNDWTLMVAVGGVLFAVSDLILSQIYFKDRETPHFVALNLVTYYAAQIFLALALVFMA